MSRRWFCTAQLGNPLGEAAGLGNLGLLAL